MGKYKYHYHPDDDDSDFRIGCCYKGKVSRIILTPSKHLRAVEVEFPDGGKTTVHKRSFEVSESAIEFYPVGTPINLKKVGYMADRRVTKWVIMQPLKYDLYGDDGIKYLMERKQTNDGATKNSPNPNQAKTLTLVQRLKAIIGLCHFRRRHAGRLSAESGDRKL